MRAHPRAKPRPAPGAITRSLSDPFTEITRYLAVHRGDAAHVRDDEADVFVGQQLVLV